MNPSRFPQHIMPVQSRFLGIFEAIARKSAPRGDVSLIALLAYQSWAREGYAAGSEQRYCHEADRRLKRKAS